MPLFDDAYNEVAELVRRFEANAEYYRSAKYQESELRKDFLDKFWTALGWDVDHRIQTNPREQEVKVERNPDASASGRKADYAFFLKPDYRNTIFFCEAKKPSRELANAEDYYQLARYGYSAGTPIGVLTNFDEFHILDCRYQPHVDKSYPSAQIKVLSYKDLLDREAFGSIYWLFSREAVESGKLKDFARSLPKQRGTGKAKLTAEEAKPVDEAFLTKLEEYRSTLAKAFKKADESLTAETLTEATQKVIDRLVFIRFLEDKYIESDYIVDEIAAKKSGVWKSFISWSKELDVKYNGVVFKPHDIDKPDWKAPDDKVFAELCADISHSRSKYLFSYIPIELLGSIYERFLGKVVVTTAKRAEIEDKPEVRKAGGVYYTPKYIVDYIVANTVGRILDGDRGPGTGNREESILTKNQLDGKNTNKKLSRSPSVADGDGPDRRGLRSSGIASEGRTVRTSQPNESRGDLGSEQYSRGMGTDNEDLHLPSDGSIRIANGDRDTSIDSDTQEIPDSGTNSKILGVQLSDRPNAQSVNAGTRSSRTPIPGPRAPLTPKEISKLRFADIACGSGSFLIAIYDTILHHVEKYYNDNPAEAKKAKCAEIEKGIFALTLRQKQQILVDNIYGVDIDHQAVEVAQLSLFLKLLESESGATAEQLSFERTKILPDLSKNIQCGNSLVEYDISDLFPLNSAEEMKIKPFSFQQAFKPIMDAGGFDAIVGNPPWGAEFASVVRTYLVRRYETVPSKTKDSYMYFIARSISLLKKVGSLGYVTPNTWLLINNAKDFRKWLLKYDVVEISDYGDGVFQEATVESSIVILLNSIQDGRVLARRIKKGELLSSHLIKKRTWLNDLDARIIVDLNDDLSNLITKLKNAGEPFENQCVIKWGIKPYQVGYGEPPQTKAILESRAFHSSTPQGPEWKPLVVGSDVDRYRVVFTGKQYIKYGKWLMYPSSEELITKPKILLRQTSDILRAGYDNNSYYPQNSVFIISSEAYDLKYLMGLLNSKLLGLYYQTFNPQSGKVFAEIKPSIVKQLPIKTLGDTNDKKLHDSIVNLVDQMLATKKQLSAAQRDSEREQLERKCQWLDSEIDKLVYQLYGLTEEEIKIVEGTPNE